MLLLHNALRTRLRKCYLLQWQSIFSHIWYWEYCACHLICQVGIRAKSGTQFCSKAVMWYCNFPLVQRAVHNILQCQWWQEHIYDKLFFTIKFLTLPVPLECNRRKNYSWPNFCFTRRSVQIKLEKSFHLWISTSYNISKM